MGERSFGPGSLEAIVAQLPPPESLPVGTLVVVGGEAAVRGGLLSRVLLPRVKVARADRCTALLARGYVRIGAGVDRTSGQDLAWAYAPDS
jgi:hypothetical protein